ncbi:hypothetical protein B0H14DRAFT_2721282, partial [Mycena olivaceomarginata]
MHICTRLLLYSMLMCGPCRASQRKLTREEQDKINKTRKSLMVFSFVTVAAGSASVPRQESCQGARGRYLRIQERGGRQLQRRCGFPYAAWHEPVAEAHRECRTIGRSQRGWRCLGKWQPQQEEEALSLFQSPFVFTFIILYYILA